MLSCAAATAADPQASSPPDPYKLWVESIKAMRAAARAGKPPYLTYKLSCDTHNLEIKPLEGRAGRTAFDVNLVHADHHYDYQVWYRTSDDRSLSQDAVTHEEINDSLFEPNAVVVDEPSPRPSASASPSPSSSATPSGLSAAPSLGTLSIYGSRDYDIDLIGLEMLDGNQAYHLHLRARHSDRDHPLTDVWVDPETKLMRKARASFSMRAVAFGGGGDGDITFGQIGKYWMMTGFDLHGAIYALVWHASFSTDMRATDITLPQTLPDAYFPASPAPSSSPRRR